LSNYEKYNGDSNYGIYSAFIVAELGELLPKYIDEGHSSLRIGPLGKKWRVGYAPYSDKVVVHFEKDDTEADARAKMLIYLILSR
jgi:hypothetical protein